MVVLQRGEPKRSIRTRVLVVADANQRRFEQAHDGGEHLRARNARQAQVGGNAPAQPGQMFGEGQHAVVFRAIAQLAPFQVIAVLIAAARIASGRLQMAVGTPTDPDVRIRRWNRELANARHDPGIANRRATRIEVLEIRSAPFAPESWLVIADVHQLPGLVQRGHRDRAGWLDSFAERLF